MTPQAITFERFIRLILKHATFQAAEHDNSSSDPEPEIKSLLDLNPNSNTPLPTDHGDLVPIWYFFSLVQKHVEESGWTHEVTERSANVKWRLLSRHTHVLARRVKEGTVECGRRVPHRMGTYGGNSALIKQDKAVDPRE